LLVAGCWLSIDGGGGVASGETDRPGAFGKQRLPAWQTALLVVGRARTS